MSCRDKQQIQVVIVCGELYLLLRFPIKDCTWKMNKLLAFASFNLQLFFETDVNSDRIL